jgi:prepilin-type N-terminal cleavage/methylation domain-containing protein
MAYVAVFTLDLASVNAILHWVERTFAVVVTEERAAMRAEGRGQAGFTLAELLTVIVIITVLAGLVLTALPRIQKHAEMAACTSNLRQIGQGLKTYTMDYGGFYPALIQPNAVVPTGNNRLSYPWYDLLIQKCGLDERIFRCPADRNYDPSRQFADRNTKLMYMSDNLSYGFNFDVKYSDGIVYRVNSSGTFVEPSGKTATTPSGAHRYPDFYSITEVEDPRGFVVAGDSNSEMSADCNYAISIPFSDAYGYRVGTRHQVIDRPGGNLLFADDHVEAWVSKSKTGDPTVELAKDINQTMNRRFFTLVAD